MLTLAFLFCFMGQPPQSEADAGPHPPTRCEVSARDLHLFKRQISAEMDQRRDTFEQTWTYMKADYRDLAQRTERLEHRWQDTEHRAGATLLFALLFWLVLWLAIERLKQRRFDLQIARLEPARTLEADDNRFERGLLRNGRLLVFGTTTATDQTQRYRCLGFHHVHAVQINPQPPDAEQVAGWEHQTCDIIVFDRVPAAWMTAYAGHSRHQAFAALVDEPIPDSNGWFNTARDEISLLFRIFEVGRLHKLRSQAS